MGSSTGWVDVYAYGTPHDRTIGQTSGAEASDSVRIRAVDPGTFAPFWALIKWPLPAIPATATVKVAQLRLTRKAGSSTTYAVQVTGAWDEATVTGPGPAVDPVEGSTGSEAGGQTTFSITQYAQKWVNGQVPNQGVRLQTRATAVIQDWASSEAALAAEYPHFFIEWNDPPSAPGAFSSPTAGAVVDTTGTVAVGAATDADGDALSYQWDLSTDNGASYTNRRTTQAGTSWTFDYSAMPATTTAKWRVRAWDGEAWGPYSYSSNFEIRHNVAPTAPTGLNPAGNVSFDRASTRRFSWLFNDPNAGDLQSKYDLRYRLTGAPSWTTVSGTTANTFRDFPGGTFTAGTHEWQVRAFDKYGEVSPYSASEFFTAADVPAGPTITAPIDNGTVSQSDALVAWSYPSQEAFQARKVADSAGSPDVGTVYYDSGVVESSTARDHPLSFPVNDRYEHIQVRIRDTGLWSAWTSVRVLVSYTPPAVPELTLDADSGAAKIVATPINPEPAAGEPTVISHDIWRREALAGGDGIRVAAQVTPGGSWTDWTPASGVEYEYRTVAFGDNGTQSSSAWVGLAFADYELSLYDESLYA